ncbi:TolC family protein [Motilimonas eburnea]|uniref:TolC family protein n=1 Tax=Motilimonas eburnea TaxID=1737488 RepID=UPI001E30D3F2|nr:TolC family protein [Motilimonas eburnea]
MKTKLSLIALAIFASSGLLSPTWANSAAKTQTSESRSEANISLNQLIEFALNRDATREQLLTQSMALRETGVASASLMDPKMKVGIGGLPTDSFRFDDDPMTNVSIGFMQQFSRGDTLALQQQKFNQQADGVERQLGARELEVANSITKLWLELGYQQQAAEILNQNRSLMLEMVGFINTNYAIGKGESQDLLQAQLQVSQLDEKLQANHQMQRRIMAQLSQWLGLEWLKDERPFVASHSLSWQQLERQLKQVGQGDDFYPLLQHHPLVQMSNSNIAGNETQVAIANEAYKPEFGVEVMYANRQANGMGGKPASDLVSAYLTIDIPLFTGNRQDRNYAAAQYQLGAAKLQRDQLLRQMNAEVHALLVDKHNLTERIALYQDTLIKQAKATTKAVERGYENNTAQFNDVIAALRAELTLSLEQTRLITDLNISQSNLAALLQGFEYQVALPEIAKPNARMK